MTDIIVSYHEGVRLIKLNRPTKMNAINGLMYLTLKNLLKEDAKDNKIVVTIITGSGMYFSSGNDIKSMLKDFMNADEKLHIIKDMIYEFINYPKLLIAVVNGPAIGIGATIPALCDIIYATENALFDLPFVKMSLVLEACSSFNFPSILGRSKASEVIFLNHKLTAQEACQFGLVSKIIPQDQLQSFMEELHKYGKLSRTAIINNKRLIMDNLRNVLSECNEREMAQVKMCLSSEEFFENIRTFLNRKSKL